MELKYLRWFSKITQLYVLIVPLWNWNIEDVYPAFSSLSSNRTFMELKFYYILMVFETCKSSNRTFMELKWSETTSDGETVVSSNRTFMELKLVDDLSSAESFMF